MSGIYPRSENDREDAGGFSKGMKRIKILYRKNLKMSPGKLVASQCVHAALGLEDTDYMMSVVVLGVSDKKFIEEIPSAEYVVADAGYTEVPEGTYTCLAFCEDDPFPLCVSIGLKSTSAAAE
jgi:peptidyl-tRNA hydrolase